MSNEPIQSGMVDGRGLEAAREDELLPCPFCGNVNPFLEGHPQARHVTCNNDLCQASIMPETTDRKAIAAWNRRASSPNIGEVEVRGPECATEGCARPATERLERGGVGSDYCRECFDKIGALVPSPRQHSSQADAPGIPATGSGEKVPDGWKLVPVEPTEAMLSAVWSVRASNGKDIAATCYAAMLAASPANPVETQAVEVGK